MMNVTTDYRLSAAKGKFIIGKGLRGFSIWESTGDSKDILLDSIRSAMGITQ
jgi:chitinase